MNNNFNEDLLLLTKSIIHEYCNGNYEKWFSYLSNDSIFIANGEGILFGSKNIISYLKSYAKICRGKILSEEYFKVNIDNKSTIVYAETITNLSSNTYKVKNSYTFVYKLINKKTKIIYEHTSYEYISNSEEVEFSSLDWDIKYFQFIKYILLNKSTEDRLCIVNANHTFFIDIDTILYIKGSGHNTEIHCINKIVTSTKTLQELRQELPDNFYQIHRSYIINTKFLSSISCYEAELISNIKIPIPAAKYSSIKHFLEEKLNRPLKKRK